MDNCKDCFYFCETETINTFGVGTCGYEPFQLSDISNDHSMTVICGQDGGVQIGEMFGCVNFVEIEEKEIDTYCQRCFKREATMRYGPHEESVCGGCYTTLSNEPMSFL